MSKQTPGEAFKSWHADWWKNRPNPIAENNAQQAFFAGWDAAKQNETKSGQAFCFSDEQLLAALNAFVAEERKQMRMMPLPESDVSRDLEDWGPQIKGRMRAALEAATVTHSNNVRAALDADEIAEVIRVELSKGIYDMTTDRYPYDTTARAIAYAIVAHLRGEA